jgi:hypothetical protein
MQIRRLSRLVGLAAKLHPDVNALSTGLFFDFAFGSTAVPPDEHT